MNEAKENIPINKAFLKVKENKNLTRADIQPILKDKFLLKDSGGFNLLDWAIMHHNYNNIKFLLTYIHPNNCEINCVTRLFRGKLGGLDGTDILSTSKNIANITDLLLEHGCNCPSSEDLDEALKRHHVHPVYYGRARNSIDTERFLLEIVSPVDDRRTLFAL